MSRGSTFTLYRVYNGFKADQKVIDALKDEYYRYNKRHDYFGEKDFFTGKSHTQEEILRNDKRLRENVPLVMELDFKSERDWCDRPKYGTADEMRKGLFANYVNRDSGEYMDKLLEWDFTSGFTCLIHEYSLNYDFLREAAVVEPEDARQMLAAIEYLLGGRYDDAVEASMNNRFIKVFADGNDCDSYWKYVYRHRFDGRRSEFDFEDPSGVKVKVTLPQKPGAKKSDGENVSEEDGEEDEDSIYFAEMRESDREQEYYLRNAANALRALLESDNWSLHDDTKLVLVYSCWG